MSMSDIMRLTCIGTHLRGTSTAAAPPGEAALPGDAPPEELLELLLPRR